MLFVFVSASCETLKLDPWLYTSGQEFSQHTKSAAVWDPFCSEADGVDLGDLSAFSPVRSVAEPWSSRGPPVKRGFNRFFSGFQPKPAGLDAESAL